MMTAVRTLLLGEALVDLICERPVASLGEADAFVPHFGGAVANVAVGAARQGARVELAGGAGDDAWGGWLRERLDREGVGLEWFRSLSGVVTPVAFVVVDRQGEPSYAIYGDSIRAAIEALQGALDAAVDGCDALFITSNTLVGETERELTLQAHARALEQGKPVVFDPNLRLHRWENAGRAASEARALVKGAFLVKLNAAEARLLSGEDDPVAAAEGLLAAGAQHVVVTLGAAGALVRGGGLKLDVAGAEAQPVSAVGAGDAFMGVVLGRLAGTDFYAPAIAAALPDAVREGARAVERWGALA
jgi:sugar/nucleoside kinase (ribokinase family)